MIIFTENHMINMDYLEKVKGIKTIMAHCVHCPKEENDLIKKNNVYIAHCPNKIWI